MAQTVALVVVVIELNLLVMETRLLYHLLKAIMAELAGQTA
jgi:hypothetical protein